MTPYYEHAGIQIWHGDCREILPQLPKVDLVLTDPPYGVSAKAGMGGGDKGDGGMWAGTRIAGDNSTELRDFVLAQTDCAFAVFASPRLQAPNKTKATIVWDKGLHTGAGDLSMPWKPHFDLIHIGGHGWKSDYRGSAIVQFNAVAGCVGNQNNGFRNHPFEKPVGIMKYLIRHYWTVVIVDPFMGSGTTLRAAKDLGQKAIGIEVEERYCEIAARRLEQEVLQFA